MCGLVEQSHSARRITPLSKKIGCVVLLLFLCAALPARAGNIVLNPGFEDGSANWISNGWQLGEFTLPRTGSGGAMTGCGFGRLFGECGIGQWLNTVAGATYDVSLWVAESGGPPSDLQVWWGGLSTTYYVNPNNNSCGFNPDTGVTCNWLQLLIPGVAATSDVTVLTITGRHFEAFLHVDDVSVEMKVNPPVPRPVPEPGSLILLGIGIALLGAAQHKRRV